MGHLFDQMNAVQVVTLIAGSICFLLYVYLTIDAARNKPAVDAVVQATAGTFATPAPKPPVSNSGPGKG